MGGGLAAWAISSFVTYWILHPVISARLLEKKGCYVTSGIGNPEQYKAKYLRLLVENTGQSSVKDCSGYIIKISKSPEGTAVPPEQEVLQLGWSHRSVDPRNIPRGAFFHMDVISLHLKPEGRRLMLSQLPHSLSTFFDDKATYEFEVLIAADNASPVRRKVRFDYDPQSDHLIFREIKHERFPWWAGVRRTCYWWRTLSRCLGYQTDT
jgi:hypothetical protein